MKKIQRKQLFIYIKEGKTYRYIKEKLGCCNTTIKKYKEALKIENNS